MWFKKKKKEKYYLVKEPRTALDSWRVSRYDNKEDAEKAIERIKKGPILEEVEE